MPFKLTQNAKTKFKKNHYNTFGLSYGLPENGGTCPGATTGKGGCLDVRDGLKRKTCYMAKITEIYKAVGVVLADNTQLVKDKTEEEIKVVCRETVQAFIKKSKEKDLYFRLHYSGDFFSEAYTKAWAAVIQEFPQVTFWVYTRSTKFAPLLLGIPNLSLYLSCDPVNFKDMVALYDQYKSKHANLGLAWLGKDAPEQDKYRWVTCPEISGHQKNTEEQGACSKCRLCIDNYKIRIKNIKFPYH